MALTAQGQPIAAAVAEEMLLVGRVSIGMQSVEKDGGLHQRADLLVHLPAEQVGSKLARSLRPAPAAAEAFAGSRDHRFDVSMTALSCSGGSSASPTIGPVFLPQSTHCFLIARASEGGGSQCRGPPGPEVGVHVSLLRRLLEHLDDGHHLTFAAMLANAVEHQPRSMPTAQLSGWVKRMRYSGSSLISYSCTAVSTPSLGVWHGAAQPDTPCPKDRTTQLAAS